VACRHGQSGKIQEVFDVVNQSQQQWESCAVRQDVLKIGDVLVRPYVSSRSQMYELLGRVRLMIMVAKVCFEQVNGTVDSYYLSCFSGGLETGRPSGRQNQVSRTRQRRCRRLRNSFKRRIRKC